MDGRLQSLQRNVTPTRCYEGINQFTGLSSERSDKVFIQNGYCKLPTSLNPHSADNPPVETGLAVTLWVVAIICLLLIIFFCVIVLVGMTVMIFISFHQHIANQNLQQMQIKLLVTLSKSLRKKKHSQSQEVCSRKRYQDSRLRNTIPLRRPSNENIFFSPSVANSAFHPRNNTPVSSNFNMSFSSHASLSNSGPPSFSSTSHSISEDSWSESLGSSGLTVVHPIREHSIQRTRREGVEEEDRHERKCVLYDFRRRREFQQLPHNRQEQGSERYKWPSVTSPLHMNQTVDSPREYWL